MEEQTPEKLLILLKQGDVSKYFERPSANLGLEKRTSK